MNDLQIFENREFGTVRTAVVNDEPMFCLVDVCRVLDIANAGNVKARLNPKGVHIVDGEKGWRIDIYAAQSGLIMNNGWKGFIFV